MSVSPGASPSTTLASIRNPFVHQVVTGPWDRAEADVPQINASVFDECRRLIDEVAATQRATSLLLHGIAGSGKTHVMARLRAYLQSHASRVVFVSVRMDPAPSRMWRHFRRNLVDDLLRPWEGSRTRLELILRDRPFDGLRLNYNLANVLSHYRQGKLRNECAAWLRGEQLRENVLLQLGVAGDGPEEESLEEQAHEIVIHLCRLAAPDPVVLCCDEMEILESYPGDRKGLFAYARLASTLVQETVNVLVISSVQSAFLDTLQSSVHRSLFQKTSLNRVDLQTLNWIQGRHLLSKRMSEVPELAALRANYPEESLWPLPEKDLKAEFEPGDSCVARKLIHRAKSLFETLRGMPLEPPKTLDETLAARFAELWDAAVRRGARSPDDIMLQGIPMLLEVAGRRVPYNQDELPKPVDLLVGSKSGPVAISVCNQEHLGTLARRLRKIMDETGQEPFPRVVLLRDARLAIGKSAVKCHERLNILRDRGARFVQPAPEVLCALDAMRNLLSEAAAGNLLHNGEPVSSATVRGWLATHVPNVLQTFLDEFSGGDVPPRFVQELFDYLNENFVVSLKDASQSLNVPDEEIARYALGNPGQVGYLAGPPGVLFRLVPEIAGGPCDQQ